MVVRFASRDRIAADNGIGAGTVSNIIDDFKKGVQDSDYESIRELSVFCKKQGVTLNALASCIRLNNYIQSLGASADESSLESLIVNLANYPDRDPAKLIEAGAQISESGIPLEKLEEHVKALKSEKEMLQREIDEKRAILDGVYEDVESRKKLVEEYAQMKAELRRYGIGPEDPRKIQTCLQRLKNANYNAEEVIAGYANMETLRKERMVLDEERLTFEAKLATVKDVLPLAEQITRLEMGIGELLAFHSAVYEKADMERIPLDTAAYKIVEDIRDYSQLGGLKKEQDRLQQQIFMSQMFIGSTQTTLESLAKLQSLGVRDEVIQNMGKLIDFVKLYIERA
jgi:predicted RNase H-like nuclease (RuvC/YqgF family)